MAVQRSIAPELLEVPVDGLGPTLLGGFSPSSGLHHFPQFALCPYTGADDVAPARLPRHGTLWLWTTVTAPPPGYTGSVPFGFGVVELEGGLRVVTRITETDPNALTFGMTMRLVADVVAIDADGTEIVAWAFAPKAAP